MRRALLSLIVLAALPVAGAQGAVRLEKVGDFAAPMHVTGAPGDGDRLYVVEQDGTIQVVRDGAKSQFLDLRAAVRGPGDAGAGGEEGMLSMAFPPDFQTSRRFYVYFTEADGSANRVEELRAPTGDAADPASRRLVLSIPHDGANNHNGGQLQFGPDGLLYLAPGDGGTDGGALARDFDSLLGKLLRIDPRGTAPGQYTTPADNPYVGQPGRDEIWLHGLRNPFRFSFDRSNGDLTIGDVGDGTTEEITFLPDSGGRGRAADLGWNVCEGSWLRGGTTQPCSLTGSVLPAIEKLQDDGYRSIMAGYVVRDPSLPSLLGRFVYGDFFVARPRSALLSAGGATDDREIGPQVSIEFLTSFGQDAGGCLYATSRAGPAYRLVENDTRIPCAASGPIPIAAPGVDRRPALRVRVPARQRVLRLRGVVAYARCDERCRVAVGGRLKIGKRGYRLRRATSRSVAAGKRVRVKAKLSPRGRRALRRALRDGRRPKVRVGLRARDTAGNGSRLARRTVRVKR
jgi:hypothetical protein